MSRVIKDEEVWLLQVMVNLDERIVDVLFADGIVPAVLPPDLRRDFAGGTFADIVCASMRDEFIVHYLPKISSGYGPSALGKL